MQGGKLVFATPIALLMYVASTLSNVVRFLSLRYVHITSIPYVRIGKIFDLKSAIAVSKLSVLMKFILCITLVTCVTFSVMSFVKQFAES